MYGHSYFCVQVSGGNERLTPAPVARKVMHSTKEGHQMPRIGHAIREVYRRPGTDALPAHLETHYGIQVTGSARLSPGVIRVDHDGGPPWVARLMLSGRPLERTEQDAEVLGFLERSGFPAERRAAGDPVSTMDGRAVLVTEYLQGARPSGRPAVWRELGDLLGRLHTLPTEPGPSRRRAGSLHHLPQYEGGPDLDLAAAEALLADLEGRVPAEHRELYDLIQTMMPEGDGASGLPEAFVHPDPVRDNVVVMPGGPVFVDWAGAGTGPRLASLAGLLHSAGPRHAAGALAGYREHVTLTDEELGRAEGVLWTRILWLSAWQCWLACVSAKVHHGFYPRREHVTALAAQVRNNG
jgi:Ser/Thr protein kinase RdoA (MazF antagonist)